MKPVFALFASLFVSATFTAAKSNIKSNNEYIICTFNKEVTSSEISELQKTGISIIKVNESDQKIVYIEKCPKISISPRLKSKIYSLTLVNFDGQKIPFTTKPNFYSTSPSFVNIFFNFLYSK